MGDDDAVAAGGGDDDDGGGDGDGDDAVRNCLANLVLDWIPHAACS